MSLDNLEYEGYDGGLTDSYEDDITPKKRGRKKKSASEKAEKTPKKRGRKSKAEVEETEQDEDMDFNDDALVEALINGDDVDPSILDEAFNQYSPKIDLTCDTTGTINKLRSEPPEKLRDIEEEEQSVVSYIQKWCNRMMQKDYYNDSELETFDMLKELLQHIGMIE